MKFIFAILAAAALDLKAHQVSAKDTLLQEDVESEKMSFS